MKDQNKISNQVAEIAHAAAALGVKPIMIHIAKHLVGNLREDVYKWVEEQTGKPRLLVLPLREFLAHPDEKGEDDGAGYASLLYEDLTPTQALNEARKSLEGLVETNDISDGYHTFGQLYDHRIELFIALCKKYEEDEKVPVWRSKKHSDGEEAFGGEWFLLGLHIAKGKQITYHLPIARWEETSFAETHEKAPDFDGHTSEDVLYRIKSYL